MQAVILSLSVPVDRINFEDLKGLDGKSVRMTGNIEDCRGKLESKLTSPASWLVRSNLALPHGGELCSKPAPNSGYISGIFGTESALDYCFLADHD